MLKIIIMDRMRENVKIGNGLAILNSIEFLEDLSIEVKKWKIMFKYCYLILSQTNAKI